MNHRRLGRTGLRVSELCFGTSALARSGDETEAALARALAEGIDTIEVDAGNIDIAKRIGAILKQENARHHVNVLARVRSRIPFDLPSPHLLVQHVYPGSDIRAQTETLLAALGVERLAVQQLHAWCPEWLDEGDWRATFAALRREGKIGGVGVSMFDHDAGGAAAAIGSGAVDCVQVMLNLFDPSASALFALCQQHDVGVIARAPLYFGALAGGEAALSYPPDDWRHAYFYPEHAQETAQRVGKIAADAAQIGPIAETALRFALTYAAVSTVAVGMRTPAQVAANIAAAAKGPLDPEQMQALIAHRWLC